jgi:asparagine synthase (glutamine-hydrolysing)
VFAFIIHDGNTGQTFVGRDPIGVRPIFYGHDANMNYGFASESKALLNTCDPETIKPFPAGSYWCSSTEKFKKWYNPTHNYEDTDLTKFDEEKAFKLTAELLYKAVCKRMMSDRPIGTFLSGGLDSSIVAAFIKKFHKDNGHDETNLNTFSIGLEGSPDLAYSEILAKYIGSTHHHVEI